MIEIIDQIKAEIMVNLYLILNSTFFYIFSLGAPDAFSVNHMCTHAPTPQGPLKAVLFLRGQARFHSKL